MGSKVTHCHGSQNKTDDHVLTPFLLPNPYYSDVKIGHLQPKRERIENKINAEGDRDANKEIGNQMHIGKGQTVIVVHEAIQLDEANRCYQSR